MPEKHESMALKVEFLPISALKPYENNAKVHTSAQIEHICNSIREFGFNDPIGVWTNPENEVEIVTGHGAVAAAQKLGLQEVPVTFLDHMTDEQRRAYCHVHNQTQLETGFEYESLVADMDNLNFDWENFGFEAYCYDPDKDRGTGAEEVDLSDFDEENFNAVCPRCGMRFNA